VFDFAVDVWVFDGEIEGFLVDGFGVDGPGFGRISEGFLELHEVFEVVVVEWIGFAEIAARIELVVPDFARGSAFFEEEDNGLDSCTLEGAAGIIEDGVEVTAFEQQAPKADGSVVGIGQKGVFDDDAAAPARFESLDEMLQKEESGFAGLDI